MAVKYVESLVLRSVSVLRDGQAVGLRLGSYTAKPQSPQATPFSMRHLSLGCEAMPERSGRPFPTGSANGNGIVLWAGRLSRAGVLDCRSRTIDHRWSATVGGPLFTAAESLCLHRAKPTASVADATFRRSSELAAFSLARVFQRNERSLQQPPAGITGPATRTPPATSTRGNGAI